MEEMGKPQAADGKKRIDAEAILAGLPPHLTAKVGSLNNALLSAFEEDEHERFVIPNEMLPPRLRSKAA